MRFVRNLKAIIVLAIIGGIGLAFAGCSGSAVPSTRSLVPSSPAGTSQGEMQEPLAETTGQGAEIYAAKCQSCHGGAIGGSMMDIPPPHNANGHTWHHPDCQLVDTVLNGSGEMGEMMRRMMGAPEGTPTMPAFKGIMTEEEVDAVLAHIKTWWTKEQRQQQARMTSQAC